MQVNHTTEITLEVVSPVFIGGSKENDFVRGLDYFIRNNNCYFLQRDQFLASLSPQDLQTASAKLSSGDAGEFQAWVFRNNFHNNPSVETIENFPQSSQDSIRAFIRDGFGNCFIPGSSIKGALRSIILHFLNGQQKPTETSARNLLGSIDANLMRFIHVADAYANQYIYSAFYPVKIFSADEPDNNFPHKHGMWKDRRQQGHVQQFDQAKFVQVYEMLNLNEILFLRVNWPDSHSPGFETRIRNIPNGTQFFRQFPTFQSFQSRIKAYTEAYLNKEIQFFKTYEIPDYKDSLISGLEELKRINQQSENTALLRLGANVGAHSITGDWLYADHRNTGRGREPNTIKWKTRKFAFTYEGKDDDAPWKFYHPGYVKISTEV